MSSSSANRPARLNRALLALIGLALILVGAYAILAHAGMLHWVDRDAPLVPGTAEPSQWVFVAVVAGAVVVGLAALRWLAAQFARLPARMRWHIGTAGNAGETLMDSNVAAAPVATDIESYPEVRSARARLSGPGGAPHLHLVVTAEPDADLTALRRRILSDAVNRLRQALEVDAVPVSLELRLADRGRTARAK
ncbi:alkaline shock response membrane anchor protein AmaP [Nocardia nova]|uniref:Alkaline shock response membrane anchor protein AmaP n=1 Tax=Nocardia nova TaxID=37330 RepID=A0A2S6AI38_9NOCA|nr:alkaline shock response membrane anchor protein AmaP [Nocardia nova]PPJ24123.1 alkaline shock response membrane anchor protein AmaP [Nocardia nova]PPJ34893.1 alkaline shock response membrane anchor protein AmaP [Nocardia nova]